MANLDDLKDYNYPNIEPTDYIDESLERILDRDNAAKHSFRRVSSFPTVTPEDIGMKVYLVGQGNFQLVSYESEPQWKQLTDDSRSVAYTDWVIENYQPLSKILTSLSRLKEAANALPYFNGPEDLRSINLSGYMKNVLALTDEKEVIKALKLGTASSLNYPIDGKYLEAGTIPLTALSDSLIQNLGFSTGDTKFTLKTSPDSGWVIADDGSIGSATSGATNRANADTYDLFNLLWHNPYCTLQTFSGGSTEKTTVADDWKSNKRLVLPRLLGRVIGVAGQGQNLTKWDLGSYTGEEKHTLTVSEMPSHSHSISGKIPAYSPTATGNYTFHRDGQNLYKKGEEPTNAIANTGGGQGHNNMQPTSFLNLMIKL